MTKNKRQAGVLKRNSTIYVCDETLFSAALALRSAEPDLFGAQPIESILETVKWVVEAMQRAQSLQKPKSEMHITDEMIRMGVKALSSCASEEFDHRPILVSEHVVKTVFAAMFLAAA